MIYTGIGISTTQILAQFGVAGLLFVILWFQQKASERQITRMIEMQSKHQDLIHQNLSAQVETLRELTKEVQRIKGIACPLKDRD